MKTPARCTIPTSRAGIWTWKPAAARFTGPYTGTRGRYGTPRRCLHLPASAGSTGRSHRTGIPIRPASFHPGACAARRESRQSFLTLLDLALEIDDIGFLLFRHLEEKGFIVDSFKDFFPASTGQFFVRCQQQVHRMDRLSEDAPQCFRQIVPNLAAAYVDIGVHLLAATKHRNEFTVCHGLRSSSMSVSTGFSSSPRQP